MPDRYINATGGLRMEQWSAGEWGGVFAGIVAGFVTVGKGIAWLLDWNRAGLSARDARLSKWEDNLAKREQTYREKIEGQLKATRFELRRVEIEIVQLRTVLNEVTGELHRVAPDSPALSRAAELLRANFPIDHETPAELAALARQLGEADEN